MSTRADVSVAVDGSKANREALGWAALQALRTGGTLQVVAVAEPHTVVGTYVPEVSVEEYVHPIADEAVELASETLPSDRVVASVRSGHPVPTLLEVAEQSGMLVVGKRGRGAIERLLVGSTSIAVAGRASVPVVVVAQHWDARAALGRPVVLGIDLGKPHPAALDFALSLARERGVSLRVVRVWEPHPALVEATPVYERAFAEWETAAREDIEELRNGIGGPVTDIEVEHLTVVGQPVHALLEAAADGQVLVLGRDPKERLSGFSLGSVARGVLHHSEVPVAVVPAR